jgi:hypothetical protein
MSTRMEWRQRSPSKMSLLSLNTRMYRSYSYLADNFIGHRRERRLRQRLQVSGISQEKLAELAITSLGSISAQIEARRLFLSHIPIHWPQPYTNVARTVL